MHVTAVAAAREMGDGGGGPTASGGHVGRTIGAGVNFESPFEAEDSDLLALRHKLCDCMLDCAAVS